MKLASVAMALLLGIYLAVPLAPSDDAEGRPRDAAPDIGAYER